MFVLRTARLATFLGLCAAGCAAGDSSRSTCASGARCATTLAPVTGGAVAAAGTGATLVVAGRTGAASLAGASAGPIAPPVSSAAGVPATLPGRPSNPGAAGMALGMAGRGMQGAAGVIAASAGHAAGAAGATTGSGTAGASAAAGSGATGEFEAERVACIDYINMYRATRMLPALKRGSAVQEACSDKGAKKDGDSQQAHGSASDCLMQNLYAQNTCPGYPVGAGGVTKALTGCLDQMWAEGEPPQGSDACKMDLQNCYEKYGHWINMTDPAYKSVVCSFYKMSNGNYWMNQNFGSQ
jgi:Cysteine-rich secretory protein family